MSQSSRCPADSSRAIVSVAERLGRIFFDESESLAGVLDLEGQVAIANRRALALAGVSLEEVVGRPFWECLWWSHDPMEAGRVREAVARARAGETVAFEAVHRDPSGGRHFVAFTIKPVHDTDGRIAWLLPEGRDVTAEVARREGEERFRALIEEAPIAIFLGRNSEALFANPAGLRMFRAPMEALRTTVPVATIVAPQDRERVEQALALRASGGDPGSEHDLTLVRQDGTEFPAHVVTRRFELSDGPALAWLVTDLTERREAQAALSRLAAVVEQGDDDIILAGVDSRVEYVNPAFARRSGTPQESVVGGPLLRLFKDTKPEGVLPEIERAVEKGEAFQGRFFQRGSGFSDQVYDVSVGPLRGVDGQVTGSVIVRRDVTRQVQIEARATNAERLQAIGTLAGGIAHDFNNVLGAIIGYAELAQLKLPERESAREDIDLALLAARRASKLVSQILTFARQTPSAAEPLVAKPIVNEALKFLRSTLPAGVEMREMLTTEALITSDPSEIQRLVVNLCTNAALAMREGGILEVHLEEEDLRKSSERPAGLAPNRYLKLTVRDTGHGIPIETQARIFEPFFTTRPQGTGMGLSEVHGIALSRGGAVTVESTLGKGSTFRVYLPITEVAASVSTPGSGRNARGTERILFVDDEPMLADIAKKTLGKLGYEVETRGSGPDALVALKEHPHGYDLVISDMNMPRMSGIAFIHEMRKLHPDLPAILATGMGDGELRDAAARESVDAFITKPIRMAELAAIIRQVLDRAAPRRSG